MMAMLVIHGRVCTAEYGLKDKNFAVAWNEIEFLDVQRCALLMPDGLCDPRPCLPSLALTCPHPNHVPSSSLAMSSHVFVISSMALSPSGS